MGVFSTHLLCPVLQCPGIIPGFTGDGVWTHLAACASRDETSPGPTMTMDYGTTSNYKFCKLTLKPICWRRCLQFTVRINWAL